MCPSSWKLYVDDFSYFGSSLVHLEPELELFEVWEIMVRQIIITIITKLQTALARFLDELERNQKKENHLNTISKMMGTLVQVQLYTFSYRKALFRPQTVPKIANFPVTKENNCCHVNKNSLALLSVFTHYTPATLHC